MDVHGTVADGVEAAPRSAEPAPAAGRLSGLPDWLYLLREFHDFYRGLSSGGSELIRAHQRRVRARLTAIQLDDAAVTLPEPCALPVTGHLRRALDRGKLEGGASFVRAIEAVAPTLAWRYGYERMPRGLARKFGFAEFAGPTGPVVTDRVILGIVLFAPGCIYPAHAHDGITESYVCLSGAMSENDQGVFMPGSLILNAPGKAHRITVSDREPCLLAWAWEGPPDLLGSQKMRFTRRAPG
jgi:dimethylpropiothetin dethiomethylase